jgi:preprotein translocase subunit SecY
MQKTFKRVFTDATLRRKALLVLGLLALTRVLAAIPLPGVDSARLAEFFSSNQLFQYLSIFSGSGFSTFSIALLGLGPYITASILIQVSTMVFPQMKKLMHEEGEAGRKKISQYTRVLTVPFSFLQGFGLLKLLTVQGFIPQQTLFTTLLLLSVVTASAMILLWIGELITEQGIGNGVSLIIFSGIAASMPGQISRLVETFDPAQIPLYIVLAILAVLIIAVVVFMNEAERRLPITYARAHGATQALDTYIPLKLNQAGMIPIIFALALFTMPQFLAQILSASSVDIMKDIGGYIQAFFNNTWLYLSIYFFLVFGFTYFYTSVVVEPEEMAKNLHKRGAYVPGIRPGESTAGYIGHIVSRITFVGALFLGLVAILPIALQSATGITALAVGGTSVLIAVSTALETYKKMEAQATLLEY